MDELKECPFCGGGAEYDTFFNYVCEDYIAVVKCVDCYAFVRCEEDTEQEALDQALHDWNERVERDATRQVQRFAQRYEKRIEELESFIRDMWPCLFVSVPDDLDIIAKNRDKYLALKNKARELGIEVSHG